MGQPKHNNGFSLIEVLVASLILALVAAGVAGVYASLQQLGSRLTYRYTALNLAKDYLEFGEAGLFQHNFAMKHYYDPATSNTIESLGYCEGWGINGIDTTTGYKTKEWKCGKLDILGDIEARGLVPKGAPHSVRTYWVIRIINTVTPCPPGGDCDYSGMAAGGRNPMEERVEVTWREAVGEATTAEAIRVIPIRHVNSQLQLLTAEFWWE